MPDSEAALSEARRHVAEFEQRVQRQKDLIDRMERDNHPAVASHARRVIEVLEESLRLARAHLQLELEFHGDRTSPS